MIDELRNELLDGARQDSVEAMRDVNSVKEHIRSTLSPSIYARTKRRPVVIPVVMEV